MKIPNTPQKCPCPIHTEGKPNPPTHALVSPLFCLWGRSGASAAPCAEQKAALLLERLPGSRAGTGPCPLAVLQTGIEAPGCSPTLSASWNCHSRDTWGGRGHSTKAGPDPGHGWAPSLPVLGQLRHWLRVLKQNQFAASPFSPRNWAKPAETLRGEGLPSPHRAWGPGAKFQTQGAQRDSRREQESQPGSPGTSLESARKKNP